MDDGLKRLGSEMKKSTAWVCDNSHWKAFYGSDGTSQSRHKILEGKRTDAVLSRETVGSTISAGDIPLILDHRRGKTWNKRVRNASTQTLQTGPFLDSYAPYVLGIP